jgi:MoxR-like ATPase
LTEDKKKTKAGELIDKTNKSAKVITDEISNVVLGKEQTIEILMAGVLANGNILFEDYPGLAKTLMSNTLADTLGCDFKRIQFTPDLLPADITGSYFYDPEKNKFTFRKGPIFCNILLADEINRAPPKTQAALLEAMQEKQITIEGTTHKLSRPFIVLATQNPIEYEGTYPLPEAQMDRFLIKMSVGYPDEDVEVGILQARADRKKDSFTVKALATPAKVVEMHKSIEEV